MSHIGVSLYVFDSHGCYIRQFVSEMYIKEGGVV